MPDNEEFQPVIPDMHGPGEGPQAAPAGPERDPKERTQLPTKGDPSYDDWVRKQQEFAEHQAKTAEAKREKEIDEQVRTDALDALSKAEKGSEGAMGGDQTDTSLASSKLQEQQAPLTREQAKEEALAMMRTEEYKKQFMEVLKIDLPKFTDEQREQYFDITRDIFAQENLNTADLNEKLKHIGFNKGHADFIKEQMSSLRPELDEGELEEIVQEFPDIPKEEADDPHQMTFDEMKEKESQAEQLYKDTLKGIGASEEPQEGEGEEVRKLRSIHARLSGFFAEGTKGAKYLERSAKILLGLLLALLALAAAHCAVIHNMSRKK